MTREETKRRFKQWCQTTIGNNCSDEDEQMFNNIMALLEQEPCEDVISREKTMQIVRKWFDRNAVPSEQKNEIEQLPPVQPQQNTVSEEVYMEECIMKNLQSKSCMNYKSESLVKIA